MGWKRNQHKRKRNNKGKVASDEEINRRIRKPMPPPTRIEDNRRLEDEYFEDEYEWDDE